MGPDFEAYLASKKIDSAAFKHAEPELWKAWKDDFDQMHPNSFTVQKLNLINPVRRKYHLAIAPPGESAGANSPAEASNAQPPARPGKPVMKPRPKIG